MTNQENSRARRIEYFECAAAAFKQLAFVERAAEVRAGVRQGVEALLLAREEDGGAFRFDFAHLAFVQLFAREGYRSHTVTSAVPPPGLDVNALRKLLDTKHGVVIAGGQGKMTGKMVRVGHLGAVADGDVVQVIWAIEKALEELDIAPADGRGVAAVTASVQGVPAATR